VKCTSVDHFGDALPRNRYTGNQSKKTKRNKYKRTKRNQESTQINTGSRAAKKLLIYSWCTLYSREQWSNLPSYKALMLQTRYSAGLLQSLLTCCLLKGNNVRDQGIYSAAIYGGHFPWKLQIPLRKLGVIKIQEPFNRPARPRAGFNWWEAWGPVYLGGTERLQQLYD